MTDFAGYDLERLMPFYLTKEAKEGISRALKDFPDNINYGNYIRSQPSKHKLFCIFPDSS